jgi:hypothetical protein
MRMRHAIVLLFFIGPISAVRAQEFRIEDVGAAALLDVARIKPGTIAFTDQINPDKTDNAAAKTDAGTSKNASDPGKPDNNAGKPDSSAAVQADAAASKAVSDAGKSDSSATKPDSNPGNPGSASKKNGDTSLIHFADWENRYPIEKKFLALFPSYAEPMLAKTTDKGADPKPQKLYMYVAQARFMLDAAPAAIDPSHYVTLAFLDAIDPAIKHKVVAATDLPPLTDDAGTGNDNPDRKWCAARPNSICIKSTYMFEGKIPMAVVLVNTLQDTVKKVADHIDFDSEFSAPAPADLDQDGLQQLTGLNSPVSGVLEQNIFYVNQIMKFGKFLAIFQADPADSGKTIVTAFMTLAVKADVLDRKREYESVPVLHNLVPEQVLMGQSSFNVGGSISAGLPLYARNQIKTVATLLERDTALRH